ncbi:MAG: polynucleotide adenylyltransferase PcnB [Cardiobacteriaceae bacterium]|nr:polynucleotide adenylyltransferase PcnB [Cardiobacteriaceae bacterium]
MDSTTAPSYDKALPINESLIDPRALRIIETLQEAGHEAYLVGGCLRDLLLGQQPKDFDIATSARPQEVAALFRNSRLIGRRFVLVHIFFGREFMEIATFRASSEPHLYRQDNRVVEDNVYGTMQEDVERRDFTINALYYNPKTHELIDLLHAKHDIENRLIRIVGDAQTRYLEDPVRMIRAARFAAKLDMELEAETEAAILPCLGQMSHVPPARLEDECNKLFLGGYGEACFERLRRYDLFKALFPDADHILHHPNQNFAHYSEQMIRISLRNTDNRMREGKPVTVAFIFAAILWPVFQLQYQGLLKSGHDWHHALHEAIDVVLIAANERVAISQRQRAMIREIWSLQARLEATKNSKRKTDILVSHPRFRAAFDFLQVRLEAGEPLSALVERWLPYHSLNHQEEEASYHLPPTQRKPFKRHFNKRRKS